MRVFLSTCLACAFLVGTVSADTVELFLLKNHDGAVKNLNIAREEGHQIVYYYLDAELAIEEKLNREVKVPLDRIFQSVVSGLTEDELKTLGDEGVTEAVSKLISTDREFQQYAEIMKSVSNDPDITQALARAEEDKKYAIKQGVEMDDLPAVFLEIKKHAKVTDLKKILTEEVSE